MTKSKNPSTKSERIKVIYRSLKDKVEARSGKGVWGYSTGKGRVYVDIEARGKKKMELIIHECLHELDRNLSEEEVIRLSVVLTRTLWHEKFRQMDDDETIKLQDGK